MGVKSWDKHNKNTCLQKMVFGFGKRKTKQARPASGTESVNPEAIPLVPSEVPVIPAIQPKSAEPGSKTESKPNSAKKPISKTNSAKKPISRTNSAKKPISKPNSAVPAKPKSKSVVVKKTNENPEKSRQSMPEKLKPLKLHDTTKNSIKPPKAKPVKKRSANHVENE